MQSIRKNKSTKSMLNAVSGITLIALVVTIVVLLILASVSITVVFGDNGILQLAKEAGEKTNEAVKGDKENIGNLTNYIKSLNWDVTKVTAVTTKDGAIVPVPKGFTASEVDGENSIETGFVIYQGEVAVTNENVDGAQLTRNQFVWVPVQNPEEMYGINEKGDYVGKLYDFTNITDGKPANLNWRIDEETGYIINEDESSYREPSILLDDAQGDASAEGISLLKSEIGITATKEDGTDDIYAILDKWEKQLKEEFKNMIESVKKYGGFYIGRYETGNLVYNKDNTPVIQKNNELINMVNWYYMYQKSKKIAENNNSITSSMIWGCQWDATMKWFLSSKDPKTVKYVTYSMGNYGNDGIATGSNPEYGVNNIFDMAGNEFEFTMETNFDTNRVGRGGGFGLPEDVNGSSYPAGARSFDLFYPNKRGGYYGSRSTIYINI